MLAYLFAQTNPELGAYQQFHGDAVNFLVTGGGMIEHTHGGLAPPAEDIRKAWEIVNHFLTLSLDEAASSSNAVRDAALFLSGCPTTTAEVAKLLDLEAELDRGRVPVWARHGSGL